MKKVVITGGSGLIGQALSEHLSEKGYKVYHLSRKVKGRFQFPRYFWNPKQGIIDPEALRDVDYLIHLAGANIGTKRWTKSRKQEIITSRVDSARLLFKEIKRLESYPKAFISASAIGWYNDNPDDQPHKETDKAANNFLGHTCQLWEAGADKFTSLGIRTVKIRTGVVLTGNGGMLPQVRTLIRTGLGAVPGSGRQYLSWIHINDLCRVYSHAMENIDLQGAVNAVTPISITLESFTFKLTSILRRKIMLPNIPGWILKLVLGKRSRLILKGGPVSADKLLASSFQFRFERVNEALLDLIN